jgi:hypothetical protein
MRSGEAAAVDLANDAVLRGGDLADLVDVLLGLEARDARLPALLEVVSQLVQSIFGAVGNGSRDPHEHISPVLCSGSLLAGASFCAAKG